LIEAIHSGTLVTLTVSH